MADNYLEKHYAEYEKRKEAWLRQQRTGSSPRDRQNPWRD